jgi:hypothetical protein
MMARPRNPKPKPKKSNNDYRGGAALLKKQQEANTKKYKAMTPTQKKAYNIKQAKAIGKTAIGVASMVGGAGVVRAAAKKGLGKAIARNLKPTKKVKVTPIKGVWQPVRYPKSNVKPITSKNPKPKKPGDWGYVNPKNWPGK